MTIDGYGEWRSLGKIPVTATWNLFPLPAIHQSSSFRLSYFGKFENSYSQCWLRECYLGDGFFTPSTDWIRIYPKESQELLFLPWGNPFQQQQLQRYFQARKKQYRTGYDPPFSLKIEEFIPSLIEQSLFLNPS